MKTSKICPKCKIEKSLTLEYWYTKASGKFLSPCIECRLQYEKLRRKRQAHRNPLEIEAEKALNKRGVPTRRYNINSWDLEVWGCIYIEVKPTSGNDMVHFTANQVKRDRDNVILMIPDGEDWYILPMYEAPIVNRTFCLGKVSEHGNAYRRKELELYKNAFWIIEDERIRQSKKLKKKYV